MSGKNLSLKDTGQTQRNCAVCGLPIGTAQRGSLTGWIFRENRCKCSGSFTPVGQGSKDGGAKQKDSGVHDFLDTECLFGNRYQATELVGEGGMGAVYRAQDFELNQTCAIKVLRSDLASDNATVQRFMQEVETSQTLDHPNIVRVYDHGVSTKGAPFLVMDFLDGESLAAIIEHSSTVPVPRAINIFTQVCDAILHAHNKQIVHRDLKPTNILVTKSADGADVVKLVDFGIAKILPTAGRNADTITQTGDVFGSPLYMSPEQCRGDKVDLRSDIYSLGCVMYETLTGKPPFTEESPIKLVLNHLYDEPQPIPNINPMLERIIFACLEKKPSARYANAAKLKRDLVRFVSGQQPTVCSKSPLQVARRSLKQHWALLFCTAIAVLVAVPLTLAQSDVRWISTVDVLNKTESPEKKEELARQLVDMSTYNKPFSLLLLGEILRSNKKLVEARKLISEAVVELERRPERNANLVYAYRELLRVCVEQKDFTAADAALKKINELLKVCDPFEPCKGPHLMLGFYSRCPMVRAGDEVSKFFMAIADAYFVAGDDTRVKDVLQHTISLAKQPVSLGIAHKNYAWFLGVIGRQQEAQVERRRAFELLHDRAMKDFSARQALKNLAEETACNKGFAEAAEMFKVVMKTDHEGAGGTRTSYQIDHLRIAYCLQQSGNSKEAEKYCREAKLDDSSVLFGVANFWDNRGNYDEALRAYQRLLERKKQMTKWLCCLVTIRYGKCLYDVGRFEEAEKAVAEGIANLKYVNANQYKMFKALTLHSEILSKLQRTDEAQKTLEAAKNLRASLTPEQLFLAKKEHVILDLYTQELDVDQPWR